MPAPHADVEVDPRLVRRLLREQHPDLADLPLRRIGSGWDNEVYRLGRELAVRVPRRELGARLIATELDWLPGLADRLPLPVPVPLRAGGPASGYPWRWSVCRYLPGRPLGADPLVGAAGRRAALDLAGFLAALHVPAPSEAPRNPFRGVALRQRTEGVEAALALLPDELARVARTAWRRAVEVPDHEGAGTWVHGDLHGLNVLVTRGRIAGVLDFGDLCMGDPATDLACGWLLLDAPARVALRQALGPDEASWERGRGWAVLLSVMFLAHGGPGPDARIGARGLAEATS